MSDGQLGFMYLALHTGEFDVGCEMNHTTPNMRNYRPSYISTMLFLLSSVVCSSQITTGLVAHYSFNAGTAADDWGTYDGVVSGAVPGVDRFGNAGMCFDFDGNNDKIILPADPALQPGFPFTISLWFKLDQINPSVSTHIYSSDDFATAYSGFWLTIIPTGTISAAYGDGVAIGAAHRRTKHSNIVVDTSQWYHMSAVFHGLDSIELYINCQLDPGYYTGGATTIVTTGTNGSIGKRDSPSDAHDGRLDDIRLYNIALTPAEIELLCNESDPSLGIADVRNTGQLQFTVNGSQMIRFNTELSYEDIEAVRIMDISGREVAIQSVRRGSDIIQLPELSQGTYVISLISGGRIVSTTKYFSAGY